MSGGRRAIGAVGSLALVVVALTALAVSGTGAGVGDAPLVGVLVAACWAVGAVLRTAVVGRSGSRDAAGGAAAVAAVLVVAGPARSELVVWYVVLGLATALGWARQPGAGARS